MCLSVCLCLRLSLCICAAAGGVDGRLYRQPTCYTEVTNHTMAGFHLPKSIIDDGIVLERERENANGYKNNNENENRLRGKTKG